jgi:anthranilate synthase component 2
MSTRPLRILLLDNYDSFTYILSDYLEQSDATCTILRNDAMALEAVKKLDFDAIVLSPGPCRPADAGIMPAIIDFFHDKKPILGICLGHQGIGEFFGARLINARTPVHGKTSCVTQTGRHPIFENLPAQFDVMRYHSLILEDLAGTPLTCIAQTDNGEIMAFAHDQLPIIGLQFHPESVLTPYGKEMLGNWAKSCTDVLI